MTVVNSFAGQIAYFFHMILCEPKDNADKGLLYFYNSIKTLYQDISKDCESVGLPYFNEFKLENHDHHSKYDAYKKGKNKSIKPFLDILELIYNAALAGDIRNNMIYVSADIYAKGMKSQKTIKRKVIEHLSALGVELKVTDNLLTVQYSDESIAIKSLVDFARACNSYNDKSGRFYFYICDFDVLNKKYEPDIKSIFEKLLSDEDYTNFVKIHEMMTEDGYECGYKLENFFSVAVTYTNKKMKASPLLSQTYSVLFKNPYSVAMRFVAVSRITPIISHAPINVQNDFYDISGECNNCGWCRNQKHLLRPSLLKVGDREKYVCWYRQKTHYELNTDVINLLMEYVKLHDMLLVA